jgi:hypothetical protein
MRDYGCLPGMYAGAGSVASVYLRLALEPGDTGRELPLRWRALWERLAAGGAGEDLLTAIDERVRAAEPSDRALAIFARDGRVACDRELEDFDGADAAGLGVVPIGVPLLRWQQQWVACVTAVVDRVGADLDVVSEGRKTAHEVVVGPDDEIERNAPGGWAQGRYQHRAEDSWAHNAAEVARRLNRLVSGARAQLVLVAGDVRAVQLVGEHLPDDVRRLQQTVTSGLEPGSPGRSQIQRSTVRRLVHEAAAAARAETVRSLREAIGSKDAVAGLTDTVEALRRSAVGHLLVVHRPDDPRAAHISPDPLRLLVDDQPRGHADDIEQVPLAEALVRAAFAQSADVTVLEPDEADLAEGVGALVRF